MGRPLLLDLFCGAGGCAVGYRRAGFDVVGVDIEPQPRYPFRFVQGDALEHLAAHGREYDAIHASPPCQAFSTMRVMGNAREHSDLLTPTRELLLRNGKPWVIENVSGAPLDTGHVGLFGTGGVVLCGSMFGLATEKYELRRHRLFETPFPIQQLACRHGNKEVIGFYGDHARSRQRTVNGHRDRGGDIQGNDRKMPLVRDLMGIDWMLWHEATQAIPPAYTEHVGKNLLAALEVD